MERFSGIEGRVCLKWGGKRAAELAIRGPSPSEPHPGLRTAPAALRASVWSAEVAPAWRTDACNAAIVRARPVHQAGRAPSAQPWGTARDSGPYLTLDAR